MYHNHTQHCFFSYVYGLDQNTEITIHE